MIAPPRKRKSRKLLCVSVGATAMTGMGFGPVAAGICGVPAYYYLHPPDGGPPVFVPYDAGPCEFEPCTNLPDGSTASGADGGSDDAGPSDASEE
jgi:hypothetical protein